LYLPIFLATVLVGCIILEDKDINTHCKPEVYVRIAAGICLGVAAFFSPSAFLWVLWQPILGTGYLIAGIAIMVWLALKSTGLFIWSMFTAIPFVVKWLVGLWPWVVGVLTILGVSAYVAMHYDDPIPEDPTPKKDTPKSKEDVLDVQLIGLSTIGHTVWGVLPSGQDRRAELYTRRSDYVRTWLNGLVSADPSWSKLSSEDFRYKLQSHPEYNTVWKKALMDWQAEEAIRQEARCRRQERCDKLTNYLHSKLVPVGKAIAWPFKQSAILTVYLWEVAKARKQGACPYKTFHD
jgi:hypothetical protein